MSLWSLRELVANLKISANLPSLEVLSLISLSLEIGCDLGITVDTTVTP